MSGAWWFAHPGWLPIALGCATALALYVRAAGQRRGWLPAGWGLLAGSAAWLVTRWGGFDGQVLVALAATATGLWWLIELSRRQKARVSGTVRGALVLLRLCAWCVLLTLLARPGCNRVLITYERPILAIALDQSASMALRDVGPGATTRRADLANAVLARTGAPRARLERLYDVRLSGVGADAAGWEIRPEAPTSPLAAALRAAGQARTGQGRPPVAVLLVSDGAENVADGAAVRDVAETFAAQNTALLAVGVGPEPGETPGVTFLPWSVPERIGVRDVLPVRVAARVQGCRGWTIDVELLWDGLPAAAERVPVSLADESIEPMFRVSPPGPGAHRLTARVVVPTTTGPQAFSVSTVVEVVDDQIRVLVLEGTPRNESAFVLRALRSDPTFAVTPRFTFDEPLEDADPDAPWAGHDVILLGRIGSRWARERLAALGEAVIQRGAGLLIVGGSELFGSTWYADTALGELSPVLFGQVAATAATPLRVTPAGRWHGALAHLASDEAAAWGDAAVGWELLPPIEVTPLTSAKAGAVVLAVDSAGRPVLAAQEVGRGRVLAAGWEGTWIWALSSDEGHRVHTELWRQMVTWLANRRPRAWVVTDRAEYTHAALVGGQHTIEVRAGVSQWAGEKSGAGVGTGALTLQYLDARPAGAPQPVPLVKVEDEWRATLPRDLAATGSSLRPGAYELRWTWTGAEGVEPLTAVTRFEVQQQGLEQRPPTANLPLLRAAARQTAAVGGKYVELEALPALLAELGQEDRRERVESTARYDLVRRDAAGMLTWLVAALAVEWLVRRRAGLA